MSKLENPAYKVKASLALGKVSALLFEDNLNQLSADVFNDLQ
jgi:hypothetical protein